MAKARAATPVAPSRTAEELTRRYVDAIRRLQNTVQKQVEGAVRSLAATPEDVQTRARNDGIELVTTLVDTLKDTIGRSDATPRLETGLRTYILGVQRITDGAQRDVAEAVREYVSTLREIPTVVRQGIEEAFAEYTTALQDRLAQIEIAELSPEELVALGQSMTTVGLYSRAAQGK